MSFNFHQESIVFTHARQFIRTNTASFIAPGLTLLVSTLIREKKNDGIHVATRFISNVYVYFDLLNTIPTR